MPPPSPPVDHFKRENRHVIGIGQSSCAVRRSTWAVGLVLALTPGPTVSQSILPLSRTDSRPLVATVVDSIGDEALPFSFQQWSILLRDGLGGWYVSGTHEPGRIFHLADDGGIQAFGRVGQGPGEFSEIPEWLGHMPDGSLGVVDRVSRRFTALARDLSGVLSTTPLPGEAFWVGSVEPERLLVQSWIRTPNLIHHPLHWISKEGELLASFGQGPDLVGPRAPLPPFRVRIMASGDIVMADRWRYRLQRFDSSGAAIATYHGDVEWFPRLSASELMRNVGLPLGSIYDIWSDGDLVWTAMWIRVTEEPLPIEVPMTELGDFSGHYDSVIELIDIRSAQVVASQRFRGVFGNFVGPGEVLHPIMSNEGFITMKVLRLSPQVSGEPRP